MFPLYQYVNTQGYELPDDDKRGVQALYGEFSYNLQWKIDTKNNFEIHTVYVLGLHVDWIDWIWIDTTFYTTQLSTRQLILDYTAQIENYDQSNLSSQSQFHLISSLRCPDNTKSFRS